MSIVFFTSLFGLIAMIFFKTMALRNEGEVFWSRLLSFSDDKVHRIIYFIEKKYKLYRKILSLFIFEFLPSYSYEKTVKLKDYIAKKYYSGADSLKGNKRMLRSNGSVSSFLQNITKDNMKTIEDGVENDLIKKDSEEDKDKSN